MLILTPKVNVNTLGIVLLEVVWKVMKAVIYTQIKTVVQLHDVLHRLFLGRDTGTAIMVIKLAQKLASVDQDPIFLVFLDLSKSYDNLDCGRLLQTLAGKRAGPKQSVLPS